MTPVPRRRSAAGGLAALGCLIALTACSGGSDGSAAAGDALHPQPGGSVTARLGVMPIPSPPAVEPTPVATRRHPQLLAMGQPVTVDLPAAAGTVTSFGPFERTPYGRGGAMPTSTVGTITLTMSPTRGSLTLRAADFLSRDETGKVVSLAPVGAASVTASPGHPAQLKIAGTFTSGAAQVTWRYQGHVIVIWDFNIELD